MKLALVILLALFSAYGATQVLGRRGDEKMLDTIRAVRHGASKDEVKRLFNLDPQIVPAKSIPYWMQIIVPEKEKGEYWYYFMGYPSRNIIIYFDESNSVVFATWQHT
jgi:hypothetical protein